MRAWTRTLLAALALVALASPVRADRIVHEATWLEVQMAGQSGAGTLLEVPERGFSALHLDGTMTSEGRALVLSLDEPALERPVFEVRGQVRTQGLHPAGDLRVWAHYEGGERDYAQTAGSSPPLASLGADEDWRAFAIPLAGRAGYHIERVELEVLIPGGGSVDVGPVRVVEMDQEGVGSALDAPWWSEARGETMGAGVAAGLFLIGALVALLALLGVARGLALAGHRLLLGVGALGLLAGLASFAFDQPAFVSNPLLAWGAIGLVAGVALSAPMRRRYEKVRLSRMPRL